MNCCVTFPAPPSTRCQQSRAAHVHTVLPPASRMGEDPLWGICCLLAASSAHCWMCGSGQQNRTAEKGPSQPLSCTSSTLVTTSSHCQRPQRLGICHGSLHCTVLEGSWQSWLPVPIMRLQGQSCSWGWGTGRPGWAGAGAGLSLGSTWSFCSLVLTLPGSRGDCRGLQRTQ